jgi:indolepyruvate decarboxylase
LRHFLVELANRVKLQNQPWPESSREAVVEEFPKPGQPMTVARLIRRLDRILTPNMTVVADTGDGLFAALELRVHESAEFLASAFYTTMGFAVPAALGAHIARPERRPLILVGDGAFQMTGTELATAARLGLNPLVIVFNNGGYSTERFILEGPFNDISTWRFDRLGEVFGPFHGFDADTEDAFEVALQSALKVENAPCLINVHLRSDDASPAMRRLTQYLHARVDGK